MRENLEQNYFTRNLLRNLKEIKKSIISFKLNNLNIASLNIARFWCTQILCLNYFWYDSFTVNVIF